MRFAVILLIVTLSGCSRQAVFTKGQLAAVERSVDVCSAATAKLTPMIGDAARIDLQNVAIDARNRCSVARADIAAQIGVGSDLDACRLDVDAQARLAGAELAFLDAPTPELHIAAIAAVNSAIVAQTSCGAAIDRLR